MIEFNTRQIGDTDEFYTCRVTDGAPDAAVEIEHADELLTPLETLTFEITYPLTNPAVLKVANKGGFTRKDFIHAVYNVYSLIYNEEGPDPEIPNDSMLLNRPRSFGKYGIWGHVIGDLWLEGADINANGKVKLAIGS